MDNYLRPLILTPVEYRSTTITNCQFLIIDGTDNVLSRINRGISLDPAPIRFELKTITFRGPSNPSKSNALLEFEWHTIYRPGEFSPRLALCLYGVDLGPPFICASPFTLFSFNDLAVGLILDPHQTFYAPFH